MAPVTLSWKRGRKWPVCD